MASIKKRTYESGKTGYRVQVRLRGYPAQTATFERLTDARRWAQQTEAAIREGRHFQTAEAKKHTLSEAIDRYLETVMPSKRASSIRAQTAQLEWWRAALGPHALSDITPAKIGEARDRLARGKTPQGGQRSPSTVKRYTSPPSPTSSAWRSRSGGGWRTTP